MSARYPLEELATLRGTRAQAATIDLGRAIALEAKAQAAVEAATADHAACIAAARAVTLADDEPLPIAFVLRRAAYALRLRRDLDRARAAVTARQAGLAAARASLAAARAHATSARGEREVVDRHRERWTDDRRRARERLEDE